MAIIETGAGSDGDLVDTLERVVLVDLNRDNPRRSVRLSFLAG